MRIFKRIRFSFPHLKQDILEVPSRPRVGVDATDEDIVVGVQVSIYGLQLLNHLKYHSCKKNLAKFHHVMYFFNLNIQYDFLRVHLLMP